MMKTLRTLVTLPFVVAAGSPGCASHPKTVTPPMSQQVRTDAIIHVSGLS